MVVNSHCNGYHGKGYSHMYVFYNESNFYNIKGHSNRLILSSCSTQIFFVIINFKCTLIKSFFLDGRVSWGGTYISSPVTLLSALGEQYFVYVGRLTAIWSIQSTVGCTYVLKPQNDSNPLAIICAQCLEVLVFEWSTFTDGSFLNHLPCLSQQCLFLSSTQCTVLLL